MGGGFLNIPILDTFRVPALRSSGITTWEKCQRKHLYQDVIGLQPRKIDGAMEAGSVFHDLLQSLYLGNSLVASKTAALEALNTATTKAVEAHKTSFGWSLEEHLDDLVQATALGMAMGSVFWHHHPIEKASYKILEVPGLGPCVEKVIKFQLMPDRDYWAIVQFDLVATAVDEIWIIDHKSTSDRPSNRAKALRLGIQPALYYEGLKRLLKATGATTIDPVGHTRCVHNIVMKPTIKYCPTTKDKGGYDSYITRCLEWYQEQHAKDPQDPPLLQSRPMIEGDPFADRMSRVRRYLTGAVDSAQRVGPLMLQEFPPAGDYACSEFHKLCPFMDLCNSEPATWHLRLDKFTRGFREDEKPPDLTIAYDGTILS